MSFFNSSIGRFRLLSLLDAASFIYLLYCSIYLKRIMGDADAIKIPGMVHGVFFSIYLLLLLFAMLDAKWSIKKAFLISLTSIVPFLPFFLEGWLKKEQLRVGAKDLA